MVSFRRFSQQEILQTLVDIGNAADLHVPSKIIKELTKTLKLKHEMISLLGRKAGHSMGSIRRSVLEECDDENDCPSIEMLVRGVGT